jgi:NAD(P)-dependent dehydrogenase (short-subunit alcohol dehydrogenase family)
MELRNAVVLVVGGASGLGAATCAVLAEAGAKPFVADLQPPPGGAFPHATCDVRDESQVGAAIQAAQNHGVLRGVVQCAGVLQGARVVGRQGPHDLELFRRVIDVNLIGAFNVCRLAAAAMLDNPPLDDQERGALLLTASIAAWEGQIGQAAYSASKAGVVGMVLPMARELGRLGIRVAAIAPGVFETPMMRSAPDDVRRNLADQIPFPQRFGQPREFAALARHVLENSMINGEVIRLDGALRMQAK